MPVAASALVTYALCPTCTGGGTAATPVNLNDLLDVTLTAPLGPGMALVWNPLTNQWINRRIVMDDLGDADTTTDPPQNGEVLVWDSTLLNWVPRPAGGCAMYELGGVGGQLLVNDGLGVPNPVATGWTLQSAGLHAIATTAPVGAPVVFQVRIEPAGTVLTTGTIAAGNNIATFTAFPDTAFNDGEWVEVVVTASNGTAEELTVIGETCGPGGTTATPSVLVEVGEGAVLPATAASGELWRLIGSANVLFPDGLYWWDGAAWRNSAASTVALSATFTQAAPALTWTFAHGLSFTPGGARFEDLAGNDLMPDNVTITATTVTATFLAAQAGRVFVS